MNVWNAEPQPKPPHYGPLNFSLFILRGIPLAIVIYGLLIFFLMIRVFEWPWGRPISPTVTKAACWCALKIIGLKLHMIGKPMSGRGAVVSNHSSWLDIFVCNSVQRIVFVAKSELAKWTGIFVKRVPRESLRQRDEMVQRIANGERLLFFPEGTSTDGMRVLPFKPTLFAAFFAPELPVDFRVQPMTVRYRARPEQGASFYGFWGEAGFAASLFKVLSSKRNGDVDVIFHEPVFVSYFSDRKQLASHCETTVRGGLTAHS